MSGRVGPLPPSFNNTYSLAFDGVDDYVDCGDVSTLSNATTFTYSGWYKQSTLDVIAYMFGSYIDVSNRVFIYTWSNGLLNFQIEKSGTNYYARFDYSTAVTAGQWFHLAVVYDGSGATNADKVKIYIDGVLMTLSFIGAFPTSTPLGTNLTTIGKVDDAAQTWNGSIDEVALFSTTKTGLEIADIYNSGVPNDLSAISGLTNWYRNGDPDGQASYPTITDVGSGSNDGTMTNMIAADIETNVPT